MKYCECKEPKTVDVIIQHKKHQVCSKRLGGCGEEYKPKVLTGSKATISIDGVEVGTFKDVRYGQFPAVINSDTFEDYEEAVNDFFNFDSEEF